MLYVNSRYDALYGVDRAGLADLLDDELVPVVHLGQIDGLRAVLSAGLPVTWTVVCLWCPREETERRLADRGDEQTQERLKAWDETLADLHGADPGLFDLSLSTTRLSPHEVAQLVARVVALEPPADPSRQVVARRARQLFGPPRFIGYLQHCGGSEAAALELYRWNNATSAAMWEVLGYFEIALRNALAARMSDRHRRQRRRGSWLDDPLRELDWNARDDIAKARNRVVRKSKTPGDGQTIAELGLGFWRYLLARRYSSNLWPDLAGAFPNAPDRARETVELPVIGLHEFRNRLAHHERIWTEPIRELHAEALLLTRLHRPGLVPMGRDPEPGARAAGELPPAAPVPLTESAPAFRRIKGV
jgi:hypothetical protein